MSRFKNFKSQKGSVTLYTLVSMIFFLTVSIGVYTNSNNKLQSQEKQINQIQESYEQERDFINIEEENKGEIKSPKIQIYGNGENLTSVNGATTSQSKTIYTYHKNVTVKLSPTVIGSLPVYSETIDGTKKEATDNEIQVTPTRDGVTIYAYSKDIKTGEIYNIYNAITIKLTSLENKQIYVAEGKTREITMTGTNVGEITFSENSNEEIAIVEGNKTLKGLKAGTTTFKATENNGGAEATLTAKVTKIELSKTSAVIEEGEQIEVDVTGINYGTITAKSSNTSLASVIVEGTKIKVTGIKKGTVTITVTEGNGGAEASLSISVDKSIQIPTANKNLIYNGKEQQGVSEGAGYTVTNGKAINAGKYTATVSLEEGMKWTDGTTEDKQIEWEINKIKIKIKQKDVTMTYGDSGAPTAFEFEFVSGTLADTDKIDTSNSNVCWKINEELVKKTDLQTKLKSMNAGTYRIIWDRLDQSNNNGVTIVNKTDNTNTRNNYEPIDGETSIWFSGELKITGLKRAGAGSGTRQYTGKEDGMAASGTNVTWSGETTGKDVGTYTAIATPIQNYEWSNGGNEPREFTWKITPAQLKITAENKEITYGDEAPTYTYKIEGLLGEDKESDVVSGTPTYTVKNGNNVEVTINSQTSVGGYNIMPSGLTINSNNYGANYIPGHLTIKQKDVTIKANAQTVTYGTSITNNTTQITVTGLLSGHTVSTITLTQSTTNVTTTGTITPSAATIKSGTIDVTNNYNIKYETGTLTISAKDISNCTVTLDPTSYTYDGTAKKPKVTVKNGDTTLKLDTSYTVAYSNNINAGTATVTITGKGNFTGTVEKTFTINKRAITVKLKNVTITYGDKNSIPTEFEFECIDNTSLASCDKLDISNEDFYWVLRINGNSNNVRKGELKTKIEGLNAGAYSIGYVGVRIINDNTKELSRSNYDVTWEPGTLTINKATLTITANNINIGYGTKDPSYTYKVEGLVNDEKAEDIVTGKAKYTIKNSSGTTVTLSETTSIGEYTITPSGLTIGSNYTATYATGTLEICPWKETTSEGKTNYRFNLSQAFGNIKNATKSTFTLLVGYTDDSAANLISNRKAEINLNGKTITKTQSGITINKGTELTCSSGFITSSMTSTVLLNYGTLIIKSGEYNKDTSGHLITNTGTCEINNATLTSSSKDAVFNNSTGTDGSKGTVNIGYETKVSISNSKGPAIQCLKETKLNIFHGEIKATGTSPTIKSSGIVAIGGSDTTIEASSNDATVYNSAIFCQSGIVTINNGIISSAGANLMAIKNEGGTINIKAGTINSNGKENTIYNGIGTLNIQGGTISGGELMQSFPVVTSYDVVNVENGTIKVNSKITDNIALAVAKQTTNTDASRISGGTIKSNTYNRSKEDVNRRIVYCHAETDGLKSVVLNITGGTIGNTSQSDTTTLSNIGIEVVGHPTNSSLTATCNMTGGNVYVAARVNSNTDKYYARGVVVGKNGTLNLNGGSIYCFGAGGVTGDEGIAVLIQGGTCKFTKGTINAAGPSTCYAVFKKEGTYSGPTNAKPITSCTFVGKQEGI